MLISVINQATTPLGFDLQALLDETKIVLDRDFFPIWGRTADLKIDTSVNGDMGAILTDTADQAGALGYHDKVNGKPVSHIFVKTTLDAGEKADVTWFHEIFEMLLDPPASLWVQNGIHLEALEASDAVEETDYQSGSFRVSNFVLPSYFSFDTGIKYDFLGLCTAPFQLLKGGYKIIMKQGRIGQQFGSIEKEKRFAKEDRRLHRSEFRLRRVS